MIGAAIRTAREQHGLTLRALAGLVGVSHVAVCHWEADRKIPSDRHLVTLAQVLGAGDLVTLAQVLGAAPTCDLVTVARSLRPTPPDQLVTSAGRRSSLRRHMLVTAGASSARPSSPVPVTVAALYIDELGPYVRMPDVEAWGETRDARRYDGPLPVVAHPPCAGWSRLRRLAHPDPDRDALALLAVGQVRAWGGVLEHPAHTKLWAAAALPLPGDGADAWGGWSLEVRQVAWGHACAKPTWLYFVGVRPEDVHVRDGGVPTHRIAGYRWRPGDPARLKTASAAISRRSPPAFARWLVDLASSVCTRRAPSHDGSRIQIADVRDGIEADP